MMRTVIDKTFTPEQIEVIQDAISLANETINLEDKIVRLSFNNNGRMRTTAGRATTQRTMKYGMIDLNKRLFLSTGTISDFKNTVLHELAHIYANFYYGVNCGHDAKWKGLFTKIGGNGKRCHSYEVNHLKAKTKSFEYSCDCGISHSLGIRRHNKILNKISRYRCGSCKSVLTLKEVL